MEININENLIDNVFTLNSYRYVPDLLKKEWKNILEIYTENYWTNKHKHFEIFPQIRIDLYNFELKKINFILKLIKKNYFFFNNLIPKYTSDVLYSQRIKSELLNSLNIIKIFCNNRKKKILDIIKSNNIPNKTKLCNNNVCQNIENFKTNDNNEFLKTKILYFIIIITIIIFLISLN